MKNIDTRNIQQTGCSTGR